MIEPDEHLPVPEPPRTFIWHQPDTLGTILALARTDGQAPPAAIHVRPGVWERIFNESNHTICEQDVLDVEGIAIVIDPSIPLFPGYEIHREVW